MTIPAVGFPTATIATKSNTPTTPRAAFLNGSTPYGSLFGPTSGSNYLNAAAATGGTPSTTTLSFAAPTPAGSWGFALGGIDADTVRISTIGPGGALTVDQLGFQSTFNYCTAATPRPASCGGSAQADVPTSEAGTATLVDISGQVTLAAGGGAPTGKLWLPDPDGNEVATTSLNPMAPHLDAVTAAVYSVEVVPPAGYEVVGAAELPADASAGDVTDSDFVLQQTPPTTVPTTTTTTTSSTTSTTTAESTTTTITTLAASTTSSTTLADPTTSTTFSGSAARFAGSRLPTTGNDGGATTWSLALGAAIVLMGSGSSPRHVDGRSPAMCTAGCSRSADQPDAARQSENDTLRQAPQPQAS